MEKRLPEENYGRVLETGVLITEKGIEEFLQFLREKGRVEGTLIWYRRGLGHLCEALPDRRIRRGTLARWREELLKADYAPRTVNLFISVANTYLEFMGYREYQLSEQLRPGDDLQPELSRGEYLRLLQTAKVLGRERVYLLVKVFASTGLPLQELPKLTVEAAQQGKVEVVSGGIRQMIRLPDCVRQELNSYAKRKGIHSGPIFVTRDGKAMSRTNVSTGIRQLCIAAQIPEEKGNPRCLKRLYQTTRTGIENNIALLVEQAHDRLLEDEQLAAGWEEKK